MIAYLTAPGHPTYLILWVCLMSVCVQFTRYHLKNNPNLCVLDWIDCTDALYAVVCLIGIWLIGSNLDLPMAWYIGIHGVVSLVWLYIAVMSDVIVSLVWSRIVVGDFNYP